jgi:hypothetical protein
MMKSLSPSTRNNIMTCLVVLLIVGLILWLTFKTDDKKYKSCPKPAPAVVPSPSKILIPIGNGQSVALTREEYQRLSQAGSSKEGFYVSSQEYIPSVQTENEYIPMLSLYKPKETTRVIPEPTPAPVPVPVMPVPVPVMPVPMMTGANGPMMTGANGPVEGYGNVFLDNFEAPKEDVEADKYRMELTAISPFFLNNGKIANAQMI